jgi:hypothetical protein
MCIHICVAFTHEHIRVCVCVSTFILLPFLPVRADVMASMPEESDLDMEEPLEGPVGSQSPSPVVVPVTEGSGESTGMQEDDVLRPPHARESKSPPSGADGDSDGDGYAWLDDKSEQNTTMADAHASPEVADDPHAHHTPLTPAPTHALDDLAGKEEGAQEEPLFGRTASINPSVAENKNAVSAEECALLASHDPASDSDGAEFTWKKKSGAVKVKRSVAHQPRRKSQFAHAQGHSHTHTAEPHPSFSSSSSLSPSASLPLPTTHTHTAHTHSVTDMLGAAQTRRMTEMLMQLTESFKTVSEV